MGHPAHPNFGWRVAHPKTHPNVANGATLGWGTLEFSDSSPDRCGDFQLSRVGGGPSKDRP